MVRGIVLVGWLVALARATAQEPALTAEQRAELPRYFGFGRMQIYRIKPGIAQLKLGDLNGDGRTDIALWNGHQSRFELFYQPEPGRPAREDKTVLERNEIGSEGDMRRQSVSVAYRVASVEIGDLTGDGRADLVFFGEPRDLVILPGRADGEFGPPVVTRAPEGEPRGGVLALGDFNRDGRRDVALLGRDVLQIYPQKPEGGLGKPLSLVHGIKQPTLMMAADINGDGLTDLAIGSDEDEYAVYACLQDAEGGLSSLRRIKVPNLRSMTWATAPGGDDLFAVEAATNHLKHYRWQVPPESGAGGDWPQRVFSYPFKIKAKRIPLAIGDLTGDGSADCVMADPDAAQLVLFRGTPEGLGRGTAFPGLMKTVDLLITDMDGDGRRELLSVSSEEKAVGISTFADGRITFPKPLAIRGVPLAVTAGELKGGAKSPCLACLVRPEFKRASAASESREEEEEPGSAGRMLVQLLDLAAQREVQSIEVGEIEDPSGLRLADVDQDGRADLLIFSRFSSPLTFLQREDGTFCPLAGPDTGDGLLKNVRVEACALADVTGDGKPEVLVAQKSLARALVVQRGRWNVIDQYNPETADAEITGVAALPSSADGPTIVMYDRKARDLLALKRREDHTYAVARTMPIGNFDLSAMAVLPVGSDGRAALLLADAERLVLFSPEEVAPTLVARHSYESDAKDAMLGDAVVGDLNHDGVRDVVAVDIRKAALEILTTLPNDALERVLRFQVFQGKRFSGDPSQAGQPHEVLVGDVTGDQVDDIVLLVHDRMIVYPGE